MSGMKLHLVRSDPLEQIDCLVKAIVLALGKSDQQFESHAARPLDCPSTLRSRDPQSFLVPLPFNQIGIPTGNIKLRIGCHPKVALHLRWISRSFR